jgi:hypothetical protein
MKYRILANEMTGHGGSTMPCCYGKNLMCYYKLA